MQATRNAHIYWKNKYISKGHFELVAYLGFFFFFFLPTAKSQGSLDPGMFSVADRFSLKQEEFQCHIISQTPKVKPRPFLLVLTPPLSIHIQFSHLTCPLGVFTTLSPASGCPQSFFLFSKNRLSLMSFLNFSSLLLAQVSEFFLLSHHTHMARPAPCSQFCYFSVSV